MPIEMTAQACTGRRPAAKLIIPEYRREGNHDRLCDGRHPRPQEGRRLLRQDLRRTGQGTVHGQRSSHCVGRSGRRCRVRRRASKPMTVGNGVMAALRAKDKAQVDRVYKLVLSLGGKCEGPPGQRSEKFYAAYFRDPDGNKLNAYVMG